jgi:predicted small lipoprotein YifL
MNILRPAFLLLLVLPLAACGNKGPLVLAPKPQEIPTPTEPMPAAPASAMPAPGVSVAPGTSVELRDDALDSHDDADATPPPTEDNAGTSGKPR